MTSSMRRKFIYAGFMLAAYLLASLLSLPPSKEAAGGMLYRLRQNPEFGFGAVTLGEIDPTSQTINFVLVGMRGIAANVMWQQASKLQEHHQWSELKRVVNSITLLQPHFVKVWDFQGWNLAYNVSAEWDNVEDRYYWVKEGIKFLETGMHRNPRRPELPWRVGRTYAHKIGQSDEKFIFRRMFKDDEEFNPNGEDNFLVAKTYFEQATNKADELRLYVESNEQLGLGMAPVIFWGAVPMAQTNYAIVSQREGTFGERSLDAWQLSRSDWLRFGEREFDAPEVGTVKLQYTPEEWVILNQQQQFWSTRYGDIVNYRYWTIRSRMESWVDDQSGEMITVDARRLTHLADETFEEGDYVRAKDLYETAMTAWKRIIDNDEFGTMFLEDETFMDDYWLRMVQRYRTILLQLAEIAEDDDWPPEEFAFHRVWEQYLHAREMAQLEMEMRQEMSGQGLGKGGGSGMGTGDGDSIPRTPASGDRLRDDQP